MSQVNKDDIIKEALWAKWKVDESDNPLSVTFKKVVRKKGVRSTQKIEVTWRRKGVFLTVLSTLSHPKHGRTQLTRKGLQVADLAAIFKQPRIHTGKGAGLKVIARSRPP